MPSRSIHPSIFRASLRMHLFIYRQPLVFMATATHYSGSKQFHNGRVEWQWVANKYVEFRWWSPIQVFAGYAKIHQMDATAADLSCL